MQLGLRFLGRFGGQAVRQLAVVDLLFVPVVGAVGRDAEQDVLRLGLLGLAAGAGQVDVDRVLHDRHGDDEDDQEHQHDVDQWRHVDLVHHLIGFVLRSESHDAAQPFLSGTTTASPLPLCTRAPVTK
ncbi:hypothetical protein D3C84_987170 [compost metagenome]